MTNADRVVLTRHERKDRLGKGGVNSVAAEVGVHQSLVSRVLNGKQRHDRVESAIARRVVQAPHELAFPPRDPAAAASPAEDPPQDPAFDRADAGAVTPCD